MALTPSTMKALGSIAPDFKLQNVVSQEWMTRDEVKKDKGLLVIFMCRHCPYVKHLEKELAAFSSEFEKSEIGMVGIHSNDAENYPEDSPEHLAEMNLSLNFRFPFLYDETQEVAKAYDAACTPDFFLYDGDLKLVYRGQFDDSRPGSSEAVTGKDLKDALNALLEGRDQTQNQKPSMGCNIKWK